MHREVWVTVFTFLFINTSFPQEKSIFSQAYLDPFIINPASTGTEPFPVARLSFEKRWTGFRESPSTFLITGNGRIGNFSFYTPKGLVNKSPFRISGNVALGGAVYYDKNGPISSTGGIISYAYHVPVKNTSGLSMGLSAYLLNRSVNTAELNPGQSGDDYLLNEQNEVFRVNFGVGLFYYTQQFYSGLSVSDLFTMQSNNSFRDIASPAFYFIGGYKFENVTDQIDLEPSIIIRKPSDDAFYIDLYARAYFMQYNWGALAYSTSGQIEIMVAFRIYNSLYLGYNYMYNLGKIASYNYGSHRISLGINMGIHRMTKLDFYN